MRNANSFRGVVMPFLTVCLVAACTTQAGKPSPSSKSSAGSEQLQGNGNKGSANANANPGGGSQTLGGGNTSGTGCGAGSTAQGCPCTTGQTAACWTGPAEDRNVGECHDGTQACVASAEGELSEATWGPCEGEVLTCGVDASVPVQTVSADAGVDSAPVTVTVADAGQPDAPSGLLVAQNASAGGGASPCQEQCGGCVPGAVIGCYDDCNLKAYCDTTATQTCLPNGTWGACTETGTAPMTAQCWEYWGNCTNYNDGAGSYAGDCDSVFVGCAQPFSQVCPGSVDNSQLGAAEPDTGDSTGGGDGTMFGLGGSGSVCESAGGICLPAGGETACTKIGGSVSSSSCAGSSSSGTVCCTIGH